MPKELRVLLVNSMADGALQRTERQFAALIAPRAGEPALRFIGTTLPELKRGEWARAYVAENYLPLDRALAEGADLVVLTGAEPRQERLEDEAYWRSLTRIFDWAEANRVPALLSCLAAHAAAQHFDGIRRRPLARKCSGLFEHRKISGDPLLSALPDDVVVPHSRWNDLDAASLDQAGYEVLTHSAEAGVDLFVRNGSRRWLLFQGHPEYEPDTLWREYSRDVRRFLDRERDRYPDLPVGLGNAVERAALELFRAGAIESGATSQALPAIALTALPSPSPMHRVVQAWCDELRAALTNDSANGATVAAAANRSARPARQAAEV